MLLNVKSVSKTYQTSAGGVRALDNLSLTVDRGQFCGVQGPSGCGKTTLLLIAGGLLSPDQGSVTLNGDDPYQLSPDERAGFRATNVGFVFQQFHLVPYLSVYENVLSASIASHQSDAADRARELISHFGIEHRLLHRPGQISTGERQRTALARSLMNRPKLLLADEPTGNLDHDSAAVVLNHLREFARDGAVLLVTHDDRALEYTDTAVRIRDGQLVSQDVPVNAT